MTHIRKAVVLAAGFGQRLQMLTQTCPKPLVPFMGIPILALILRRIAQTRISQVAINTHYLPETIASHLRDHPPKGLEVHVSFEPHLLGTAGVFRPLSTWRGDEPILVHNGDVITDFPLENLLTSNSDSTSVWATMGLLSKPNPTEKNQIWAQDKKIGSIGPLPPESENAAAYTPHGFTCIHTLSAAFLSEIQSEIGAGVIPFYQKALKEKKEIQASIPPLLFWADLGTPQAYWQAHQDFFQLLEEKPTHHWVQFVKESFCEYGFSLLHEEERNGSFFHGYNLIHDSVELRAGCQIGPRTVITQDCVLCETCFVERTILLPTARLRPTTQLSRSIVTREFSFSFPT
jgi:NDP-sugar pyrophosphorylase family protein